ncbi:MAG TPA: LuxR C-terminal-related transcriptional regulator, partial [Solirubrobacteraceae bacterium]|nr:LuxR C-terminal-related transcriptional regulator [Solirubrobacteraceae bacterium]
VVLAARPAEAGESQGLLSALTVDPATEVVSLAPLTASGVATLVEAALGVEPEPQFVAACWEATGGTPFLVQMLIEALRDKQVAPIAASTATVQNLATAALGRWAMLRLMHLGHDATRLAQAVAVLEHTELDQVAALAGLALPDAARAADLLVRAGVLDEAPLCFAHPLLRNAVYRDMTLVERTEAHAKAASLLAEAHANAARVAEHLMAAAPAGNPWVVMQLMAAAKEATASGAPDSAVAFLRRALAEPPSPDARAELLLDLGVAEFSASETGWHDHLAEAVELAGDDAARIAAALAFTNALRFHQRLAEAVEVCDGVASRLDIRAAEGRLLLEAMAINCGMIDAATGPKVADRARALLIRAREPNVPRNVLASAALVAALTNQPANQVADLAHRTIDAGTGPLPRPGDAPAFLYAVISLFYAERYRETQALLDAAVTQARAAANGTVLPSLLVFRAWLALRRGDLTAAEADGRTLWYATGPSASVRSIATGVLVDALIERGDFDQAELAIQPISADLSGTSDATAIVHDARGRLLFAQHRFGEALREFRAAGEIATGTGIISPCFLPWRSDAALAALALGETDIARRLSEEELELARAFSAPRALGIALRTSGLVTGSRGGETLLREAIEHLSGSDSRIEHARALTDLGALLRRSNRRVEARGLLRQAVDTAYRLGAEPLAQRAETEARATGARPRRVLLLGLEALTASERRIAELAAEGLTNREIAQALFITTSTVEGHLTNVFNKLDVKTRTELPAALASSTQAIRS